MPPIPSDKSLGSALALLSDGYTLISKRCHRHQLDLTLSPGAYEVGCNVATGEVTIPRAVVCNEKRSDAG
jgi:hypothetical protein